MFVAIFYDVCIENDDANNDDDKSPPKLTGQVIILQITFILYQ